MQVSVLISFCNNASKFVESFALSYTAFFWHWWCSFLVDYTNYAVTLWVSQSTNKYKSLIGKTVFQGMYCKCGPWVTHHYFKKCRNTEIKCNIFQNIFVKIPLAVSRDVVCVYD